MTFEAEHLPDVIDGVAVIGITYESMFVVSDPLKDEDMLFVIGAEALRHAQGLVSRHEAKGGKVMLVVSSRAQAAMDAGSGRN